MGAPANPISVCQPHTGVGRGWPASSRLPSLRCKLLCQLAVSHVFTCIYVRLCSYMRIYVHVCSCVFMYDHIHLEPRQISMGFHRIGVIPMFLYPNSFTRVNLEQWKQQLCANFTLPCGSKAMEKALQTRLW